MTSSMRNGSDERRTADDLVGGDHGFLILVLPRVNKDGLSTKEKGM